MTDNLISQTTAVEVEEGFVVEVQSFLQELMDERGMTRADLARSLGVSRARVTQIFSDECSNLTVRLLARATHALGEEPEIECGLLRRKRSEQRRARQEALVRGAANVVPLWQDATRQNPVDRECTTTDSRLDGLVRKLRAGGGAG